MRTLVSCQRHFPGEWNIVTVYCDGSESVSFRVCPFHAEKTKCTDNSIGESCVMMRLDELQVRLGLLLRVIVESLLHLGLEDAIDAFRIVQEDPVTRMGVDGDCGVY